MAIHSILAAIDEEVRKLQQARSLLTEIASVGSSKAVGQPKGSTTVVKSKRAHVMSAAGRARIAAAQKKRWAAAKKAKAQ
jgi:hypothetical protein